MPSAGALGPMPLVIRCHLRAFWICVGARLALERGVSERVLLRPNLHLQHPGPGQFSVSGQPPALLLRSLRANLQHPGHPPPGRLCPSPGESPPVLLLRHPFADSAPRPQCSAAPRPQGDSVPRPQCSAAPCPQGDSVPRPQWSAASAIASRELLSFGCCRDASTHHRPSTADNA